MPYQSRCPRFRDEAGDIDLVCGSDGRFHLNDGLARLRAKGVGERNERER